MTDKNKFEDQAHAMAVQKHQTGGAQAQLGKMGCTLDSMQAEQDGNQKVMEQLLAQAQAVVADRNVVFEIEEEDPFLVDKSFIVTPDEVQINHQVLEPLDYIDTTGSYNWEQYLDQVETYATKHDIDFGADPFHNLMSTSQRIALEKRIKEEFSLKGANCDKYDYMIAGTCGIIGGLIDVFFVGGVPGQGVLGKFTDAHVDKIVEKFAKANGWDGWKQGKGVKSAIGYLENGSTKTRFRGFKVNYDQRHGGDVGQSFNMSTKNHHLKSLGHSPDIVGLFFSILDQFNSTSHFVSDGKLISIDTKTFELSGSNFASKIFAGFCNWLGHLFSDMAGSSGATGRGSGIPIPFYSLFQFINVGEFGQHRQTFATISVQVFEKGYDFRHGMAMAIPVLTTELLTRIMWVVKLRFYHEEPWTECVPSANNPELRRMLLISHGSLCLVDTVDAGLRSGGNMIQFMLHSNLIAWARFGTLALKEINVWYREGDLDVEAVDEYLDEEYTRLLAA